MTNQQYSITPPPELVRHWSRFQGDTDPEALWFRIANEAAQWGWDQREPEIRAVADQELEACCEWLASKVMSERKYTELRAARRPKPPSLKEQALKALDAVHVFGNEGDRDAIRRALEQIND